MQSKDEGALSYLEDHTLLNGNYGHISMITNSRCHLTMPVKKAQFSTANILNSRSSYETVTFLSHL